MCGTPVPPSHQMSYIPTIYSYLASGTMAVRTRKSSQATETTFKKLAGTFRFHMQFF